MTFGGCEIINGDCIDVLEKLEPGSFDALITDPPYCSGGLYRGDRMRSVADKYSQSGTKAEYLDHPFEGDNMDQRAWTTWTAYWLRLCRRAVKPGGVAAVFTDWRQLPALYDAVQWGGWVIRGVIPFEKKMPGRSSTARSSRASSSCGRRMARWTSKETRLTCRVC